jgi:hypothetical protein
VFLGQAPMAPFQQFRIAGKSNPKEVFTFLKADVNPYPITI